MSSDDFEYSEQADGCSGLHAEFSAMAGPFESVPNSKAQISKSASVPVLEENSKKQRVAPGEYMRPDKSNKQQVFTYLIFYICAI